MKYAYPVIFTRTEDEKDTILIEVPDLEIMTEGFGVADAIEMARDAIGLSGITLEDMSEPIPLPRDINEIDLKKSEFASAEKSYVSLVDVDFTKYRKKVDNKMVRKNVTIPNWLNKAAEKEKINVSKVLQEALMEKIGIVH
ncbi:MAG: HicB family protein [Lachnospiraceae bacterium]|jgi:predicted RNase H-like HicB family nuclease|nr:HicB family protein [Lachnospiraceae bacterium]